MTMSQLRGVIENCGVHEQHGLVLSGITTEQLPAHRKKNCRVTESAQKKRKKHSELSSASSTFRHTKQKCCSVPVSSLCSFCTKKRESYFSANLEVISISHVKLG